MVTLKDLENHTLPTSSYRFDYLLAACKVELQKLLQEKDDEDDDDEFDHYYLREGVTNVVEHPSTCKNDEHNPVLKITIVEEEKEGICLNTLRMLGKVNTKPRTYAPESGVSSSSDGGESAPAPELTLSPNGKNKRSRNEEGAAAAEMTNSNKRKRGGNGGIRIQEPPPGLPKKIKNPPEKIKNLPEKIKNLPEKIKNMINDLPGSREALGAKLVIEKKLTDTDVSNTHNRLSLPAKHLQEKFLTEEDELQLCTRHGKNVGSMDVPLVTPAMEVGRVSLRRWEMNKPSGPPSISYVLTSTWNKIKEQNKLKSGMTIQLWAIRIDGLLYLALKSLV